MAKKQKKSGSKNQGQRSTFNLNNAITDKKGFNIPRKSRIGKVWFYHIINRGVARNSIYNEMQDFTKFLDIVQNIACTITILTIFKEPHQKK